MSCKLTCSRSIAFTDASRNVAKNVPRLILLAMLASVSSRPCFFSRPTSSLYPITNGFSKKLDNHCAAISLYVAHCNLCRVHESLRPTPTVQLGIIDR